MKIETLEQYLPIYEALASKVRLEIICILAIKSQNIKELAAHLNLSSAIMTMHIKKLEKAGIIKSEMTRCKGGMQKICTLIIDSIEIDFPSQPGKTNPYHQISIPVGHYTDFNVTPTCGLATPEKIIGRFDDARYFFDPDRVNAGIIWFTQGYVEYTVPNHMLENEQPIELEISLEIGSEAPGVNNIWPSDISFFLNGHYLGLWMSPADFGDKRGKYTPSWWKSTVNQYGLLKILKINQQGTFIDGQKISDVVLADLNIKKNLWNFRIGVEQDAKNIGGLTLFGKNFGNYNQDIVFRLYYV